MSTDLYFYLLPYIIRLDRHHYTTYRLIKNGFYRFTVYFYFCSCLDSRQFNTISSFLRLPLVRAFCRMDSNKGLFSFLTIVH